MMSTSASRACLRTYTRALTAARAEIVQKIAATKQKSGAFYYEIPPLLWANDLIVGIEAEGFSADLVSDKDTLNLYDYATKKKCPVHVLRVYWSESQILYAHPEMLLPPEDTVANGVSDLVRMALMIQVFLLLLACFSYLLSHPLRTLAFSVLGATSLISLVSLGIYYRVRSSIHHRE